jgi:GT2 family glycosyltransferase
MVAKNGMNVWTEHCTIGITTRDRADDLRQTIERLKAMGMGAMHYIIVDDGSQNPAAIQEIAGSLPRCRLVRHSVSAGLVRRRHEMAEMCETEFLISLDDDSYFVDLTGMAKAFDELQQDPRLALLSFCIIQLKPHERRRTQFPAGELWWFRGCGYLLRVSAFLNVGGYPKEFQYGGEETHLTMQFFRAGYKMLHCPDVVVEHRWSGGARDRKKMEYHFTRGQILVKLFNEPMVVAAAGVFVNILRRLANQPAYAASHLHGWLSGICAGVPARSRYKRLTWRQYRALRSKVFENKNPEKVEQINS